MSNILPADNLVVNKTINFLNSVDSTVDSVLVKTDNVLTGVSDLLSNLFKFIRYSLEKKQLKKIFFLLFMSLAMAILLMGVNLIFGKIVI
jgi:hypothetical protein